MIQMQYLLSVLFEEPLNRVRSLNISSDNYQIAYNLLREWYNKIANLPLYLNQNMDLPNITYTHIKGFGLFLNTFYQTSQALRTLECDISSESNPLLSALLLKKIDGELRKKCNALG